MRMRSVIVSSLLGCGSWRCGWFRFGHCFGRLRALADGDEEAVGAVARRGQAQHVAGARRLSADHRAPYPRYRQQCEIRRLGKEALDLRLILLAQEGACGIDQPAARRDEAGGAPDDAVLQL